ncbi:MAG: hypothetical protein DDG60_05320 [Anaerolineae bacterium]|nr:MAG: hypothetical protein DDG60_05320 [Anaerolineae bacterium]
MAGVGAGGGSLAVGAVERGSILNDLPWVLRLVLLLLLAFPAVLLWGRAWNLYRSAVRDRRSVWGQVLETGVAQSLLPVRVYTSTNRRRLATRYQPHILYEYQVGERRYQSQRLFTGEAVLYSSSTAAQQVLERYPSAGQPVVVWYDPRNPADAVLQPTLHWQFWLYALLGLGLMAGALLVLL